MDRAKVQVRRGRPNIFVTPDGEAPIEGFGLETAEHLLWFLAGPELHEERDRLMVKHASAVFFMKWDDAAKIAGYVDLIDRMLSAGGDRHR